ncbi:MAG: hypothetical protein KF795_20820 [Labilithrix sp.]|nr:hypothetical protein [Labilithrix sp.]
MPTARLLPRLLLRGAIASAPVAAAVACADSAGDPLPAAAPADAADAAREAGEPDGGAERPTTTCGITRAYFERCGNEGDLNCGVDGFDAWCAANDSAINSEAYRRAEALCLTDDNCDGAKRRDCEYTHYADETPTASQTALVTAYCATCEPSDTAGCRTRSTTYDPAKGIKSVDDIFVAAWEFSDAIVDEMKTKCTGAALTTDAGSDVAACAKAFAGCAADVYLDRLPDCAK